MKKLGLMVIQVIPTLCTYNSFAQSFINTDSIEFCGNNYATPAGCETSNSMIKCNNYVFTWTYEPLTDLPRHKEELLKQMKHPKKINVSVLNNNNMGYLAKTGTSYQLLILCNVNGQGAIINLWLDKPIKSTMDLPDYLKQFIVIKSQ